MNAQATKEISDWLEKLGMSEYSQRFAENKIDLSALRYLTDQDLKEIGVALGDRRKMLAAIAEHVGAIQAPPQPALTEPKPKGGCPLDRPHKLGSVRSDRGPN